MIITTWSSFLGNQINWTPILRFPKFCIWKRTKNSPALAQCLVKFSLCVLSSDITRVAVNFSEKLSGQESKQFRSSSLSYPSHRTHTFKQELECPRFHSCLRPIWFCLNLSYQFIKTECTSNKVVLAGTNP